MSSNTKGLEVRSPNTAPPPPPAAARVPLGPEWIVNSPYGFAYGLSERDGQWFLCTSNDEEGGWKVLMPADARILYAFRQFQERPSDLEFLLTVSVLRAVRERGLAS